MSDFGFSFLKYLREADDTDNSATDNSDDDFSIDNSLDDSSMDNDNNSDDTESSDDSLEIDDTLDMGDGDSDSSSSSSSTSDSDEESEDTSEEAMDANTDIFASLTAEEQQIKIRELKRLFNELYSSFDDIKEKISEINLEEYNKHILVKLNYSIYDLKTYISDYIVYMFDKRSFIENDIAYNRFLDILNNIKDILEKLLKEKEENI